MKFSILAFVVVSLWANTPALAQGSIPCDGSLYFTRQIDNTSTRISSVNVSSNGTVSVSDKLSLNPNALTNATVYYNGYIFTQRWNQSSFQLARIADYSATNNYTTKTVSDMPTGSNLNYNNAGVDKNGIMYILSVDASPILYKIDLKNWDTGLSATSATTTMTGNGTRLWGDIAFDPLTGKAYAWYHGSTNAGNSARGLYEIQNFTTGTAAIVKIGAAADYTMGTLFFNERGQLFSYGVPGQGGDHVNFYAIDKTDGTVSSIGTSATSPQSDGCECAYRLSLTLTAGDGNGNVDIPNCSKPSDFNIQFGAKNTASGAFSGVTFEFPLDPRFSFADTKDDIETYLKGIFGSSVAVMISNDGLGTNNKLNVTGMAVEGTTSNSGNPVNLPFELKIKVVAGGDQFTDGAKVDFQANFGGLSAYYGTTEPSSDPLSLWGKKASTITFNKTNDLCNTLSGNVFKDANGLKNEKVDGSNIVENLALKAVLVNEAGYVVAVTTVGTATGTYSFPVGPGKYSVRLTTADVTSSAVGTLGSGITVTPPTGWLYSGEHLGTETGNDGVANGILTDITVTDQDVTNANFGIERPPVADIKSGILTAKPSMNDFIPVDGTFTNAPALSGSDPEDQSTSGSLSGKTILITSLPTNGMELWYDNTKITVGKNATNPPSPSNPFTIEVLDPSKLKLKMTGAGAKSTVFEYAYVDQAGVASPPATYTLSWNESLPVTLVSFEASVEGTMVSLRWKTAQETNASHFELERSSDARQWSKLTTVLATGWSNELANYNAVDANPCAGISYYRLRMVDQDGSFAFSHLINVRLKESMSDISVHPNPVSSILRFNNAALPSIRKVTLTHINGQALAEYDSVTERGIDLSRFENGIYLIQITTAEGLKMIRKIVISK
ncbi:T9SS type A sorting domain-containing protein [Dyadobacter helix]|nr:T9SS type A sorting domain-containing protein [Dyadobacter sp. CECT 9275]